MNELCKKPKRYGDVNIDTNEYGDKIATIRCLDNDDTLIINLTPPSFCAGMTLIGSGLYSDMPSSAKNGELYYTTDTGMNYLWYDDCWNPLGEPSEEPAKDPEKIRVNRHTHCPSCCAPVSNLRYKCEYCGTPYEYDYV